MCFFFLFIHIEINLSTGIIQKRYVYVSQTNVRKEEGPELFNPQKLSAALITWHVRTFIVVHNDKIIIHEPFLSHYTVIYTYITSESHVYYVRNVCV